MTSEVRMGVRTLVVGYGYAGRAFHSYLVGLTSGLELAGICVRDPEKQKRAAAERGCRIYADYAAALADPGIDLVVLATPNSTHAALAIQALNAGKHVVTDKVMCLNLAEFDAMAAAQQASGKLLTVFQNRRWDGDYLTIRKLREEGRLGAVRVIETAWQNFGIWGGWRGQRAMGGGKLYDLGAHMIDQICLLFAEPVVSVYCALGHDFPEFDIESRALVTIRFASGAVGVCDTSALAAIKKPRWYVCGTGGTFVKHGLDAQEQAMREGRIDEAVEPADSYGTLGDGQTETRIPTLPGRWRSFYENVRDVIAAGAAPAVTLESLRKQITVIDAAFRSAATNEVIKISHA
jgi:scyllo-inositol 2-dehydrogenase (NADP+)